MRQSFFVRIHVVVCATPEALTVVCISSRLAQQGTQLMTYTRV